MKERRLYHLALLSGVAMLLLGVWLHSWPTVALGAMVAGAGGLFAAISGAK